MMLIIFFLFLFIFFVFVSFVFRSNLAAIFGNYTKDQDISCVIKQPGQKKSSNKRNSLSTPSSTKTEVIIAKAIHAYKLYVYSHIYIYIFFISI